MDIFIIETANADNIDKKTLLEYKKKNISNSKKLREHCFAYFMADKILDNIYKISNREIQYKNKKPFLKSKEKFFSVSHSNEYIALGFSDFDCGIDIEEMIDRDFTKIAKKMKFQADTKVQFYREWTLYEAKYKLGTDEFSTEIFSFGNYCLTACSANENENFKIHFQSINEFSKA